MFWHTALAYSFPSRISHCSLPVSHFPFHRPDTFATVEHAIGWALKGGQTKNVASARVSMPMQLCLQTPAGDSGSAGSGDGGSGGGGGGAAAHGGAVAATGRLTWKVDLAKTEPHWWVMYR